jgi:D-alanyl-D-alanine carboxypeptidase
MGKRFRVVSVCLLAISTALSAGAQQHQMVREYVPPDLVPVSGGHEQGRRYLLRREAAAAYEHLRTAATRDNVRLSIVSGFRSFDQQRRLFDLQIRIDRQRQSTVAAAGYSEHQLGDAVDFGGDESSAILESAFGQTRAGRWLNDRAPDFGFAVSYTVANQHVTGFAAEPWHYRYVGSTARARHAEAIQGMR